MVKKTVEIEKVYVHKITGNLKQDLKKIKIDHSAEQLQREIGLPKVEGKQREKIPSGFSLNPLVWYSILSGKSKQKENLYKYEDLEENVKWIRDRIEDDYFTSLNIPKERISELLEYAIRIDASITSDIKMNNVEKIRFDLEEHIQIFLSRLKVTKK